MPNKLVNVFDVLIVGGGIIGMLTARHLHSEGYRVAIIEKSNLGGEATLAAGGILSALNPWKQSAAAQYLIDEGRQNFFSLVEDLKQETNINSEFIQSGMLVLDVDEKQAAQEWARQNNEVVEILARQSLLEHEVNISPIFKEALYLPNIAQIRPSKLIDALQQSLQNNKIDVFENTTVNELLIETNKVTGTATQNGNLYAEKVIVCGGAWTKNLFQENSDIDIAPVRGQMLLYKLPNKILSHIILKDKSYLIPRQDGHILCGSTVEHVGFENTITQAARLTLQNIAHELVPSIAKIKPIKQWSGLRPGTQRDVPYICKHPQISGLYINSGHYRHGIIMSIASARIMTALISNSLNTSHIATYS
ncbi:MAG: glycine oxidase ThiO [Gammaproteobacteria bacterium]|nr:MAG: glycine oxidase ThiO [Gammaproteobacteria bacterium]